MDGWMELGYNPELDEFDEELESEEDVQPSQ